MFMIDTIESLRQAGTVDSKILAVVTPLIQAIDDDGTIRNPTIFPTLRKGLSLDFDTLEVEFDDGIVECRIPGQRRPVLSIDLEFMPNPTTLIMGMITDHVPMVSSDTSDSGQKLALIECIVRNQAILNDAICRVMPIDETINIDELLASHNRLVNLIDIIDPERGSWISGVAPQPTDNSDTLLKLAIRDRTVQAAAYRAVVDGFEHE